MSKYSMILLVASISLAFVSVTDAITSGRGLVPLPVKAGSNGHIEYVAINGSIVADQPGKIDMNAPPQRYDIPVVVNVVPQETVKSDGLAAVGLRAGTISANISVSDGGTTKKTTIEVTGLDNDEPLPDEFSNGLPANASWKIKTTRVGNTNGSPGSSDKVPLTMMMLMTSLVAGLILEFANKKFMI